MMSLATHSEISLNNGHPIGYQIIIKNEVGRILLSMGDYAPAKRHLWSARCGFIESDMVPEAVTASLEWLDLADEIDEASPTMSAILENASPREGPGNSQHHLIRVTLRMWWNTFSHYFAMTSPVSQELTWV